MGPQLITRHTQLRVCAGRRMEPAPRSSSVGVISHFFLQGRHLFPDAGSGSPGPRGEEGRPVTVCWSNTCPKSLAVIPRVSVCPTRGVLAQPQPCPSRRWPPEGAVDMPISGISVHLRSLYSSYNFPPHCPDSSTGAAARGRHSRPKCPTLKRNIGRCAKAWGHATGAAQDMPPPNVPLG